ncbi:hypothetical protein BO94DRAFT_531511 [Aspergillus sclerotioniger CBS 115572]|uniref:Uncharacterized protein n=1 Tax=Aspergillus sclerotioniger CBS 115572 TaxID=1450535 RepID=A0A317X8F4_9EURO|nr:hypothetical protein BO94DRAFT_531511 [Aspergillus sclerotioniger CBS 115572]PWY94555.1 hypothetical protein BO94DRAFT_531511 [Aspergillus sclerotioniger CBS 115572]
MSKPLHDNVARTKSASIPGRATFILLRALDVWFQYTLLHQGWASTLITTLGGTTTNPNPNLPTYHTLLTLLALGSSLKQITTILFISEQSTPISSAILIAFFNTLLNTLNTFLAVWSPTSASVSTPAILLGTTAYTLGLLTETISEFQRRAFKQNPANKGKPFAGGLFSFATNINYGGYTVWRAGYALVSGSWGWAIACFGFFFWDFKVRGVPVLERYLVERYGDAYVEIVKNVGYRLLPGVY